MDVAVATGPILVELVVAAPATLPSESSSTRRAVAHLPDVRHVTFIENRELDTCSSQVWCHGKLSPVTMDVHVCTSSHAVLWPPCARPYVLPRALPAVPGLWHSRLLHHWSPQ